VPTTPVLTTIWLDPPLQSDFLVNSAVTVHMTFADRETRLVVDPDIVNFNYSNPPNTTVSTTLTYPFGITRNATGDYQLDLPLTATGRWVFNAQPQGNPGAVAIGGASMEIRVFGTGL
jgi:hypothetical protein